MKDYRKIIEQILKEHPEIASINIEYKQVERITFGQSSSTLPGVVGTQSTGPLPPPPVSLANTAAEIAAMTGRKVIVPPVVSPELIAKLRGNATVEDIPILNAPPAKNDSQEKHS